MSNIVPVNPIAPITPVPYPFIAPPVSDIVPFSYRDGATYLSGLHKLDRWIKTVLTPYIQDSLTQLGDNYVTVANNLIAAVNTALSTDEANVNAALASVNTALVAMNTANDAATASATAAATSASNAAASESQAAASAALAQQNALNLTDPAIANKVTNPLNPVGGAVLSVVNNAVTAQNIPGQVASAVASNSTVASAAAAAVTANLIASGVKSQALIEAAAVYNVGYLENIVTDPHCEYDNALFTASGGYVTATWNTSTPIDGGHSWTLTQTATGVQALNSKKFTLPTGAKTLAVWLTARNNSPTAYVIKYNIRCYDVNGNGLSTGWVAPGSQSLATGQSQTFGNYGNSVLTLPANAASILIQPGFLANSTVNVGDSLDIDDLAIIVNPPVTLTPQNISGLSGDDTLTAWTGTPGQSASNIYNQTPTELAVASYYDAASKSNLQTIAAYGDSLTASGQGGGETFEQVLAEATGKTVLNRGISGEESGNVALRQGGLVLEAYSPFTISATAANNTPQLASTTAALSTAAAITTIPITAASFVMSHGHSIRLVYGSTTQDFTLNADVAVGDTSLTIVSAKPLAAFPAGQAVLSKGIMITPYFSTIYTGVGSGLPGSFAGIHGQLSLRSTVGGTTTAGTVVGTAAGINGGQFFVTTPPATDTVIPQYYPFVPDETATASPLGDANKCQIIWVGRNDIAFAAGNIVNGPVAAVQAMVNHLKANVTIPRFIVIGVMATSTYDDVNVNSSAPAFNLPDIKSINQQLATLYPNNFVDINADVTARAVSVAAANGITLTANDQKAIVDGVVPSDSFTVDGLHLNDLARRSFLVPMLTDFLDAKGW